MCDAEVLLPKSKYLHMWARVVPEIICEECGKRLYHENETTLKIEESVHKKFCRKEDGKDGSYMHRDSVGDEPIDAERASDAKGTPVLKR